MVSQILPGLRWGTPFNQWIANLKEALGESSATHQIIDHGSLMRLSCDTLEHLFEARYGVMIGSSGDTHAHDFLNKKKGPEQDFDSQESKSRTKS